MSKLPAYIRDTTDFLNKIKDYQNLLPQTLLVTLDVKSSEKKYKKKSSEKYSGKSILKKVLEKIVLKRSRKKV